MSSAHDVQDVALLRRILERRRRRLAVIVLGRADEGDHLVDERVRVLTVDIVVVADDDLGLDEDRVLVVLAFEIRVEGGADVDDRGAR